MAAVLAIGTTKGVYVLAETPGDWKLLSQGLTAKHVHCLQATRDGYLWAGTEHEGLHFCQNLGPWQPLVNDLSARSIHSLTFHPKQPFVMLCGTSPGSLFLSLDRGLSFEELPALRKHPGSNHWSSPEPPYRSRLHRLFLHPSDLDIMYAAVLSGGFYLSGDVGQSWQERIKGPGRLIHDLSHHPLLPGRLYACSSTGFFLSENLGELWHERQQGLPYFNQPLLVAHPEEPNIVFLATHRTPQGGGTIYRTANAGQRWEACEGLPFGPGLRHSAVAMRASTLVLGTNQGDIFMTRDLGSSWGKIRAALPPITCLCLVIA